MQPFISEEGSRRFMELEAQVAMEAGYRWQPLYDGLLEAGHDVRLAHPLKRAQVEPSKGEAVKPHDIRMQRIFNTLNLISFDGC
jgi:transposase